MINPTDTNRPKTHVFAKPQQVPRRVGGPGARGVFGDPAEVHASAADLDEEQQVEPAQQDGIDGCEVASHGCLGPEELGPRHLRSRGCGFNAGVLEDLPDS